LLYIEDEKNLLNSLAFILDKEGFEVACAATGEEGLELAQASPPDVVLLDLNLPGIDGFEVCRRLKKDPATKEAYILMLTARGKEEDIVYGLDQAADDYIPKPFQPKLLIAHLRALLRRKNKLALGGEEQLRFGDLLIDPSAHVVVCGQEKLGLTKTEFAILALLSGNPNRVLSRTQILDEVRGYDFSITERVVDFQISGLRKKLGASARHIETVRGVGYKFIP
jgi:two-component system phosphate regulon response regulator PhoB